MPKPFVVLLTGLSVCSFLAGACRKAPEPESDFRPTFTVKEIMDAISEPNADFLWDSVATIATVKGVENRVPHTDEEWDEVRHHALTLVEETNLLLVPGRRIAKPGEKAEDPKVELSPEQIEAMISQDRATWIRLVHGLHDAGMITIKAIDAKDGKALFDAGEQIDMACENCHLKYWYPNQPTQQ
jgi:hypothetical protein